MALITVSRGFLTGVGATFAEQLASCLDHPLMLREKLVETLSEFGIYDGTIRQNIQSGAAMPGNLAAEREALLVALQSVLADACASGNLVIYAEDGHLLLKTWPGVLKVCLFAPQAARVRVVANWQGLDRSAAATYIRRVDRNRSRWTKFLHGIDWKNPSYYDLALNVEELGLDAACTIALDAARQPLYHVTDSSKRVWSDLAAACRVELATAIKRLKQTNPGMLTRAAIAG